jgi:hypothetical protein
MKTIINWQLPIKTASESNCSEHYHVKTKRHILQKRWVKTAFKKEKPKINLPCKITLTRIAPRSLDSHDNLPMSLKWVADAIAENIIPGKAAGRADDSKELTWEYRQKRGGPRQYAVVIEIEY